MTRDEAAKKQRILKEQQAEAARLQKSSTGGGKGASQYLMFTSDSHLVLEGPCIHQTSRRSGRNSSGSVPGLLLAFLDTACVQIAVAAFT